MKRFLVFMLSLVFLTATNSVNAQSAQKYVLFEHFTQASCAPCAAQNPAFEQGIMPNNVGKIHHIAWHTSWPGYDPMYLADTAEVNSRVAYYAVNGVPDMIMLGNHFAGSPASVTQQMIDDEISVGSPIQILATETDNGSGRDVSIDVNTVGTPPSGNLVLRAAVVENYVHYQSPPGTNGEKDFPDVFRKMLTPMSGVSYTAAAQGGSVSFSYSYTMDGAWDPSEIYVLVWIQDESTKEVLQSGSSIDSHVSINSPGATFVSGTNGSNSSFGSSTQMILSGSESFQISMTNDAPADWSGSFTIGGNTFASIDTVSLANGSPQSLSVSVTPGTTPAFSRYTVTITSIDNPQTNSISQTYKVISGVTDLVVDNDAGWGDGANYDWESIYMGGLDYANDTRHDAMSQSDMVDGFNQTALNGVKCIYFNIGWSFPSFTDANVGGLATFLDNGGRLLVAGQDIGWDTWTTVANGGHGTASTQDFYTNYLETQWMADGGPSNSQYTAVASDAIFGAVPSSAVITPYPGSDANGNPFLYPDELQTAGADAAAIFNYNGGPKISGIRVDNGTYKVVYLGIGLENLQDAAVQNQIMQLSHDWFWEGLSTGEFDKAMQQLGLGQNYPNPANSLTHIVFGKQADNDMLLSVTDMLGQKVYEQKVKKGTESIDLDVSSFSTGMYLYSLSGNNGLMVSHKLQVIH